MWNRYSRRWLVKDKSSVKRTLLATKRRNEQKQQNPTEKKPSKQEATTDACSINCKRRQMSHKSRSETKLKKHPPRQTRLSNGKRVGAVCCPQFKSRTSPCLNYQKLEVLLVILLANCCLLLQTVAYEMRPQASLSSSSALSSSVYNRKPLRRSNLILAEPETFSNDVDVDLQTSSDTLYLHRSQNFKISPKPCSVGRIEGTCMFVWECIKSEGRHVGMCVDSFMFGSCCAHNYTDNIILPQIFSYTRPTKPVGVSSFNHRPRPPHAPHKPSISGMTTIERPHGAGTLVIRPSGPHHQGALHHNNNYHHHYKPSRPSSTSTSTSSTTTTKTTSTTSRPWSTDAFISNDLQAAESISSSSVTPSNVASKPTVVYHWQMSTQPSFITKPRPPSWDKPTRPPKPSRRPTTTASPPPTHHHQHGSTTLQQMPPSSSIVYTTRRPKPTPSPAQISTPTKQKPQQSPQWPDNSKPSTIDTSYNQFLRPTTPAWITATSHRPHQPNTTTTFLYRPTTLPPSTSQWTSTSSAAAAAATSTTSHRPTPEISTPNLDPITIESNEILDSNAGNIPIVKTVSAAKSAECGVPLLTRPETRIVGGKSAAFGRWPWQVSVRRTSFFGFSSTHRCGGALINEHWIATAGHCVDDLLTSQIRIRVGEYDFSHVQEQLPYIERGVAAKVVHPKYNFFTYEYDLALVQLESPLEFAPHVSPICLPQTDSLLIGMNATVTGWGRLSEGGTLPSVLQEVSVPIVSNDNCKSMFLRAGRQEFIPDIFLCAGYETGGQDSCQGDSGGPLQVKSQDGRFFLAGIISWGIGCAEANLPGVCTRISKFVPWILEHVT